MKQVLRYKNAIDEYKDYIQIMDKAYISLTSPLAVKRAAKRREHLVKLHAALITELDKLEKLLRDWK
jgi:hypothetical protein